MQNGAETLIGLGAPGWDRTSNPCLRRAVLYPLSYGRISAQNAPKDKPRRITYLRSGVHRSQVATPRAIPFPAVFDAGRKALPRALPRVKRLGIADIIARHVPEKQAGTGLFGPMGHDPRSSCPHCGPTGPHALPAMLTTRAGGALRLQERFHHPES